MPFQQLKQLNTLVNSPVSITKTQVSFSSNHVPEGTTYIGVFTDPSTKDVGFQFYNVEFPGAYAVYRGNTLNTGNSRPHRVVLRSETVNRQLAEWGLSGPYQLREADGYLVIVK